MKKIFVIFLSIITISSVIFLGGCGMLNSRSEREEMIQIAEGKKAQRAIEELLRQEDSKALTEEGIIKEYSINKDKLEYNPMGGLIVELIINGDPELTIKTTLMEDSDGKLEHTGYVISGELAKKLSGE